MLILLLILIFSLLISLLFFLLITRLLHARSKLHRSAAHTPSIEPYDHAGPSEELLRFDGAADISVSDILDAPGEVIGKSSYGTLYEAAVAANSSQPEAMVLRFLRPACCVTAAGWEAVGPAVRAIGEVSHANLVSLRAVYVGPRGEMLLVYPFFHGGNLAQFIRGHSIESHKWVTVYGIAHGIAKGLDHLHTGLPRPIMHGNLKSKNVLLDQNFQPCISDYGIHLLLNAPAGQEMLEASALQGYKAPELMKTRDVCESTDVYSFGVVLLELLTGKEPISQNYPSNSQETYLPNAVRSAVLHHRVTDLYHPDIVMSQSSEQRPITEDRVLKLVQLAISCCSPSPSFRPPVKEILRKIEEIGR
ncbi:hypothetical protein V2J09_014491 [Rumex salicifolius]